MAQLEVARQVGGAVEQPDAADEVGAIAGRLAPPSQLIRVFCGPAVKGESTTTTRSRCRSAGVAILLNSGVLMVGCGDVYHFAREAQLSGRVSTLSGDAGAPCIAIALLFGREHSSAAATPGQSFLLHVRMHPSLGVSRRVHARVALRLECPGREPLTTPEREVELAWRNPPTVDFGELSPKAAQ